MRPFSLAVPAETSADVYQPLMRLSGETEMRAPEVTTTADVARSFSVQGCHVCRLDA
jgi:hypothetical protein